MSVPNEAKIWMVLSQGYAFRLLQMKVSNFKSLIKVWDGMQGSFGTGIFLFLIGFATEVTKVECTW